jgi:hypothetical protein
VTIPDKTEPDRPRRRPAGRAEKVARSATNGHAPPPRHTSEDTPVEDSPLSIREPDRKLQRSVLKCWVSTSIATLGCISVVAVATGSAPTPLLIAFVILAAALPVIVRYVFPK